MNRKLEYSLGTVALLKVLLSLPSFPHQLLIFHMLKAVSSHHSRMDHVVLFSASVQSQIGQIEQPSD